MTEPHRSKLREMVEIRIRITVDVDHLAEQFAALTDDAQAQFLCVVADRLGRDADVQADSIGRHLATCSCATEGGRRFVRAIVEAMEAEGRR